jgi:hypothetical protein
VNWLLVIGILLLVLYAGWSVLSREWKGNSQSFERYVHLAPSAKVFKILKTELSFMVTNAGKFHVNTRHGATRITGQEHTMPYTGKQDSELYILPPSTKMTGIVLKQIDFTDYLIHIFDQLE